MTGPFGDPDARDLTRVEHARRLASNPGGLPALDRLVGLAARLVGAESAQVSVIADELTVMGGYGAAAASVGATSPAAETLCSVTVASRAPVAVPDAASDARVMDLPPVVSGAVGSYLGVPLRVRDHLVGALCVFDRRPRAWTEQDVSLIEQLVEPVLAELELAALRASYEDDRRLWQLAVDAAGVGAFDWELATGLLRWDERLLDLFGLDRETFGGTIEAFNQAVYPDDLDWVTQALREAIDTCGEYAAEYRITRSDGTIRWVAARGVAVAGPDGTAGRLVGAAYDTTAVRDGEARVARTLEAMPTAYFHLDRDWRFTYANPEARRLLGGIGTDPVGHIIWELFPESVGSPFERHYREAAATGQSISFEAHYPPPLDGWYEIRSWPTPDGLSVYFVDVTERRHAQDALDAVARRATLLADVAGALVGILDGEEAVTRLAKLLVPELADWCLVTTVDGVLPEEPTSDPGWRTRLRDLGSWHVDPDARPVVDDYARARVSGLTADSLLTQALRTGEMVVVAEDAAHAIASRFKPGPARDLCLQLAPASSAMVPLLGHGRVAGLMSLFRGPGRPPYDADELELLGDIAGRAGLALDNAYLYERQRDLAEGLQRSLLTRPTQHDGLDIAVRYEPAAEAAQVGGDWYDVFRRPGGALTLVIGDVIGHDTLAAATMGQLRGLLRGIDVTTDAGPADVLGRVDDAMVSLDVDTLATAVVAHLDDGDGPGRLRLCNAGHLPPVLLTADGSASLVAGTHPDVMLGLADPRARDEIVVDLAPGDTLLLYTDGLVERRHETLDDGLERLCSLLGEPAVRGLGVEELADLVLQRLAPGWTEDDIAMVVLRLRA